MRDFLYIFKQRTFYVSALLHCFFWGFYYLLTTRFNAFLAVPLQVFQQGAQSLPDKFGLMFQIFVLFILVPLGMYTLVKFFVLKQFKKIHHRKLGGFFLLNSKLFISFLALGLVVNFFVYGLKKEYIIYGAIIIFGVFGVFGLGVNYVFNAAHVLFIDGAKTSFRNIIGFLHSQRTSLWKLVVFDLLLLS